MPSLLLPEQEPIADKIDERIEECELFNIPTGRGKTYILLDVARRRIENGENVIISVPNNYLAREMHRVAIEHFGFTKENSVVKVGIENYVSRERLAKALESGDLDEYCDVDTVRSFLSSVRKNDEVFFDDFNREVVYKDVSYENIVKGMVCFNKSMDGLSIPFKELTVTNHFYLLAKTIYDDNFSIGDYTLLIDEVHELPAVAEVILTDDFSPFEYRNTLRQIRKEVESSEDFRGKIKLLKALRTQEVRGYNLFKNNISPSLVGEYITDKEIVEKLAKGSLKTLSSEENGYIVKMVEKKFPSYFSQIKRLNGVVKNLSMDTSFGGKDGISFGVFYSPSKGYPTLRTSISDPIGRLYFKLWREIKRFAGVSGSVTSSLQPSEQDFAYGYRRLGIKYENESPKPIHFYPRIFPRENIEIVIPDGGFYDGVSKDSVYSEDFDSSSISEYYERMIDCVYLMNDGKNTIVLCGGYTETKYMAELYRLKYNDRIIHCSTPAEKVSSTIEKFRKNGGILFATKNYNTGISLVGGELERLFITRLPYPDYTSKKWQEIKSKSSGIFRSYLDREMLIAFIQTLGRVPRTFDDKGKIILLDYRILGKKARAVIVEKILSIAKEYGIVNRMGKEIKKKSVDVDMGELFGSSF